MEIVGKLFEYRQPSSRKTCVCVKCIKNVQYINQGNISRDISNCNDNNGNKNKDKMRSRKEKIQFENLNLLQQIPGLSESSN